MLLFIRLHLSRGGGAPQGTNFLDCVSTDAACRLWLSLLQPILGLALHPLQSGLPPTGAAYLYGLTLLSLPKLCSAPERLTWQEALARLPDQLPWSWERPVGELAGDWRAEGPAVCVPWVAPTPRTASLAGCLCSWALGTVTSCLCLLVPSAAPTCC